MHEKVIYTIGHSTRKIEEFLKILHHYNITALADIRRYPGSNKFPQYNQNELKDILKNESIDYKHIIKLGGRRKANKNSPNMAWHNLSFRAYADYMQTIEFQEGLNQLQSLAKTQIVTIMCSEAVPWRCHRSLVADALLVRGFIVKDIYSLNNSKNNLLTPWAKIRGTTITYP